MHPNLAGQLAIALADEQALPGLSPSPVATPTPTPAPQTTTGPDVG
jgi:hypothetical protein